ncbi:MAG TPA: hypothetical protein VE891_05290 [Allosphingosinicella sp.]|nr:hypothetical protein [Allosphingosinicella sp.]
MTEKYTAILSIHGIGRHRRHANAGALLSALEAGAAGRDSADLHTIIQVRPGIEPPRDAGLDSDVPMLQLNRARREGGKLAIGAAFRVYEANWSPDTRARMPLRSMLTWTTALLASAFRREPSNWARWSRLRLARLRLAADPVSEPGERHALAVLASAYRNYRGSLGAIHRAANRSKPRFADFVTFAKSHAGEAVVAGRLEAGAQAWQRTRLPCEARVRSAARTALGGVLLVALIGSAAAVPFLTDADVGRFTHSAIPALLCLAAVLALVLAGRFLTTVFSDVRYWSALNENDKFHETRNAVLERAISMIRHLVSDPACVRVVIVSHSLGTAIAYDALRAIGLHNLARAATPGQLIEIRKVDCLITLGSPIDKLALLFETSGGRSFREELMREELRGDLSTLPFWVKGKQRIAWLNFWDPADPISDPLYGPLGTKPVGDRFVDTAIENIEVANTRLFDPGGSHTKYLANPAVASRIFDEVFRPKLLSSPSKPIPAIHRRRSRWLLRLAFASFSIVLAGFTTAHFMPSSWIFEMVLGAGFFCLFVSAIWLLILAALHRT